MKQSWRRAKSERGVALILVLLMIMVLGTIVARVVFVSQTQTWTGYNYRATTQARYAAEAGIQRTMNWLQNSYTAPSTFTSYNTTTYPVQDETGSPKTIVMSASSSMTSNYPDSTQQSNFNTALHAQSVPGILTATYSTYATLLRMTPGSGASWLGGGGVPQVWQITSTGTVSGARAANVQLQATYERIATPIFAYGVAGDGTSCPDVNFTGGVMNSWNSANGTYATTHQASGGSIGTNGNVTINGGSTAVDGTISDSFNINVGASCSDGITANPGTYQGLKSVATLSYPAPTAPSPATPTGNINQNSNSACDASWPSGACTYSNTTAACGVGNTPCFVLTPNASLSTVVSYGNLTANQNLVLTAGTYNFNSFQMNGGSVTLRSVPVVINLGGNSISSGSTLFATNSSVVINDGGIPANLQIVSACCLSGSPPVQMSNPPVITMNSSSTMYAVVYAPNSYVHITGSSQFLGAVVAQKVTSDSSNGFSYDLALQNSLVTSGNYIPVNYSWTKQ